MLNIKSNFMKLALPFLILFTSIFTNTNAQMIVKNKKATYRYVDCYIERENAETFNYADENIKFTINVDIGWLWNISIENKTKKDMTIFWRKCLFVVNNESAGIIYISPKWDYFYQPPHEEIIASKSTINTNFVNSKFGRNRVIDPQIIKETGEDYYIRLVFPIEVNGELKKYEFKYRIYLVNAEKQQKYKEKRLKKIKKQLEKVIKENSSH